MAKKRESRFAHIEGIEKSPEEVTKNIFIEKHLWDAFKAQTKKNKHKLKEAFAYGMRAYLAAYKTKK